MAKPPRSPGRPKGVPNKLTANVKRAIEATFDGMGGLNAFVEWAKEHPTEFYRLWARLLPVQVQGEMKHQGLVQILVDTGVPRAPDDPVLE